MRASEIAWDFAAGLVTIAIVVALVAPGSTAGAAVRDISGAITSLLKTAMG